MVLACTDNEGWFYGTSHNTGMSGLYPGNYVEKAKDSDCWTVHRYACEHWRGRKEEATHSVHVKHLSHG